MKPSDLPTLLNAQTKLWLRSEALAVLGLSTTLYWKTGTAWWIFLALFLAPDLTMLFYFVNAKSGSLAYNAAHWYFPAITVLVVASNQRLRALIPFALIWIAHIAFDRALGYGLKSPGSFVETHLGLVGSGLKGSV